MVGVGRNSTGLEGSSSSDACADSRDFAADVANVDARRDFFLSRLISG